MLSSISSAMPIMHVNPSNSLSTPFSGFQTELENTSGAAANGGNVVMKQSAPAASAADGGNTIMKQSSQTISAALAALQTFQQDPFAGINQTSTANLPIMQVDPPSASSATDVFA